MLATPAIGESTITRPAERPPDPERSENKISPKRHATDTFVIPFSLNCRQTKLYAMGVASNSYFGYHKQRESLW